MGSSRVPRPSYDDAVTIFKAVLCYSTTMNADWLRQYATGYHQWKTASLDKHDGGVIFYRPLGVVEGGFDGDGIHHEGRADINMVLTTDIKTTMPKAALRRHILLAWSCMRLRHTLLCATAAEARDFMDDETVQKGPRFLFLQPPTTSEEILRSTEGLVSFLDDHYPEVDVQELYLHAQNTARTFDPEKTLTRLLVLPPERLNSNTFTLRFLFIFAHQITDGISNTAWGIDFMRLLNQKSQLLEDSIRPLVETMRERLTLPQEDLYQPVAKSRARQRWFWAITVVLGHIQKPLPAAFQNPLRFTNGPVQATGPAAPVFERVLDYSRVPPLNSGTVRAWIGKEGTQRLHRLCRKAGCSIGAGAFVLVAIVMMELYEARFPDIPVEQRLPFIGSFPVNPRPFFNHTAEPDSLMLAFSDGVVLPFLPSSLDLDGRIRLLVRSAQKQLSRYQKRPAQTTVSGKLEHMGPRGAGRVVPMNYLDTIQRRNSKLPEHLQLAFEYQKNLPKQPNPTLATCGVSSVGKMHPAFGPGHYDLDRPLDAEGDLVADLRDVQFGVRPRDGEFLVGVWGNDESIVAGVSYDACAIDPAWTNVWKEKFETFLGGSDRPKL